MSEVELTTITVGKPLIAKLLKVRLVRPTMDSFQFYLQYPRNPSPGDRRSQKQLWISHTKKLPPGFVGYELKRAMQRMVCDLVILGEV